MGVITIGTSGWSYPEWRASIYRDVPQRRWLERYSELFGAVEINVTYRRDPTETMVHRWIEATPRGFRFIIKAHQRATHFNRLKSPDTDLPVQIAQAELIGDRLGAVYFQLPHNFLRNDELLGQFLESWPSEIPCAWEFIHPSWHVAAVHEILRDQGAAWVISDAKSAEPTFVATADNTYVRLRAETYSDRQLQERASAITALEAAQTWVFVRHGADAPDLAGRLGRLLR